MVACDHLIELLLDLLLLWKGSRHQTLNILFAMSCLNFGVKNSFVLCTLSLDLTKSAIFNVRDREHNAEIWRAPRTLSRYLLGRLQAWKSLATILGTCKALISSSFFSIFSEVTLHLAMSSFHLSAYFLHFTAIVACPLLLFSDKISDRRHNYCLHHQYSQKTIRIVGKINYERKQNYLATRKHTLTVKNFNKKNTATLHF